ncbi:MAG: hypothetical protein NVS2B15_24290 [Pseudarthrobacter sp.]
MATRDHHAQDCDDRDCLDYQSQRCRLVAEGMGAFGSKHVQDDQDNGLDSDSPEDVPYRDSDVV